VDSINLLMTCAIAFCAVFVLLIFLAVVMKIIISVFPAAKQGSDTALYATITAMASTLYPKSSITKIEEIK